jgi:hypothetical protein
MNKKNEFKLLISAFHERTIPTMHNRDVDIPDFDKAIAITGIRRSGKTFIMYQEIRSLLENDILLENILYINFEDDRLTPLELANLQELLEGYYELYPNKVDVQKHFFFDEIQEVENWEKFIRRLLDTEKVQIYITGSSSKLLSYDISTTLRGRSLHVNVFTLSFMEFLRFNNIVLEQNFEYSQQRYQIKKLLGEYLEFGSFPEVVLAQSLKWEILKDYYDLVVYRDIVDRYNIRNSDELKRLLKFLLTNIGNLFSINNYLKIAHVASASSKNTIHEYFSHILESKILYAVQIFSYSVKVQQINPVKVYCADVGLRKVVAFQFSKDYGRLVENIVFLQLLRMNKEVYYWKKKHEIDFIIKDRDGRLTAMNVCYEDNIPEREVKGLQEAKEELKCDKLLCLTKETTKIEAEIEFIPVWIWLLKENIQ